MSDVPADEVLVAKTDLQAGALRLPEVLMQSVTLVAPAIATLFSFGFIVGSFAGLMAPFAFAIVLLIALMLAINLSMLARLFPSAGGYFTYISRAIHPRVGLFAGWLYFLINPLVPGVILVYMGTVLDNELQAKYDFNFPWWLFVILGIGVIMFTAYRGIQLSGKLLIILGSLEILIVVGLSISCRAISDVLFPSDNILKTSNSLSDSCSCKSICLSSFNASAICSAIAGVIYFRPIKTVFIALINSSCR